MKDVGDGRLSTPGRGLHGMAPIANDI
ncbi:unnamed protein product, partial [Rotaria sp. Silwood1]